MNKEKLIELLNKVKNSEVSIEQALSHLESLPFIELGFAKFDSHRYLRSRFGEVIYGKGKKKEYLKKIVETALNNFGKVFITKLSKDQIEFLRKDFPELFFDEESGIASLPDPDAVETKKNAGRVSVITGGTSDIPFAKEAILTLKYLGNKVFFAYDVGVAGIHRLFSIMDDLKKSRVIIVFAGMDGALASVVAGVVDVPVVGVPVSTGYGTDFSGVAPLLTMLNSCAIGVSVVNINNGFGAACFADLINR